MVEEAALKSGSMIGNVDWLRDQLYHSDDARKLCLLEHGEVFRYFDIANISLCWTPFVQTRLYFMKGQFGLVASMIFDREDSYALSRATSWSDAFDIVLRITPRFDSQMRIELTCLIRGLLQYAKWEDGFQFSGDDTWLSLYNLKRQQMNKLFGNHDPDAIFIMTSVPRLRFSTYVADCQEAMEKYRHL
jgi:hypothetical protein